MSRKILFFCMIIVLLGCESTGLTSVITSTNQSTSNDHVTSTNSSVNSTTEMSTTTTTMVTTTQDEMSSFKIGGFASGFISDRSYKEVVEVSNELEFIQALSNQNTKVIEITNDLNLGYYELQRQFDVSQYSIIKSHNTPLLHPTLLESGVSKITIQDRNSSRQNESLMIYSKTGHTIKHASFIIKRSEDIVIRNLKFSELWEFDESTKGNYDRNDWDYFTIEASNGVWLDHLEFDKAYDGLVDVKEGSKNVTISWSKFVFLPNEFLYDQFEYLETNIDLYPMYKFMREGGMSIDDIVSLNSSQKKGHLIGASELKPNNNDLSVTLHHNYYQNLQDRLPRLRGGNVHLYNIVLDNSELNKIKTDMSRNFPSVMGTGLFKFGITNQGIVTTENGAVLMENSLFRGVTSPIKNNQKNTDLLYTGKFKVINSIYDLNGNEFIGGSDEANTPFVARPAEAVEFSWNNINELPYEYEMIDLIDLESIISGELVGTINNNYNWLEIREV